MNLGNPVFSFFALILVSLSAFAQEKAVIFGKITDANGKPIEVMNISVMGTDIGAYTDNSGQYELEVPAGKQWTIVFSHISYVTESVVISLPAGKRYEITRKLNFSTTNMPFVVVEDEQTRRTTMTRIDPRLATIIPTPNNSIESILKTYPGVSSNNELSSQYNVRGGNFDENLVYVNDVEIYRPFLVRSGQQEGLSFINPDLVSSIKFSAGGFEAKYGDKMSSVLDITYKRARKTGGTATMSLLGASAHLEGATKNYRLSYLCGIRQMTNQYVLGSLDTQGDYSPSFSDFQTLISYDITPEWDINFLGNFARNKYNFVPETRETDWGTVNEALRLTVYFDGQEVNSFQTTTGAFYSTWRPRPGLKLKFISSIFNSREHETFDVMGQYWLGQLDNNFGSDNLGEVKFNRGVGTFLNHARNRLDAIVYNIEHKGYLTTDTRQLLWGLKYQHENIEDRLSEWKMIDSAGYSLPQYPYDIITLQDIVKTTIYLSSNRITGYGQSQHTFYMADSSDMTFQAGVRFNYWDLNNQLVVSPRASISYRPKWKSDFVFRASSGYYYQPPFYRELRNFEGKINRDLKAQQSIHFVLGSDYNFHAWNRPFKMITEVYYKHLDNLVPYEIDNVRLRYYAQNSGKGYATGIDMKVNGEFVKGIDSWMSLSVMKTMEDIKDDFYINSDSVRVEPGYIPRPTDQRVNFGLFFQDYLPKHPTYKMHLNLLFGSGMPFGPPTYDRYKDTLRIPPYRRVDIGFSKQLKTEEKQLGERNVFRHFKTIWISVEVFNLLQVNNTISYLWIKDVSNRQYAVPNYLTSRRINLKLQLKF